jgi:DNA polymerase III epsilon subunit family exonuclease
MALGVFKAAQLIEMSSSSASFTDFTTIDIETTDNDTANADVVEIAAVRVRGGRIVDRYSSLVKPRMPIAPGAAETHGITDADVAGAPSFAEVWPLFRTFCGDDVIVAHNGYEFDFRILSRLVRELGEKFSLTTFDTLPLARDLFPTSRKLVDLARQFGIDPGTSHRALDDAVSLAHLVLRLNETKLVRGRKTALVSLLDHLGVALSISDGAFLHPEAVLFRKLCVPFAFSKYSDCIDWYQRERGDDDSLPSGEEVISRLGGAELLEKMRREKTADERYPVAMKRLRSLIEEIPDAPLADQMSLFLERVVLSKWEGQDPDRERVNLLTLHSTKGLEFSRVYVVGAEDGQLPGGSLEKAPKTHELEEARRLLYVGMTRTIDRLVLTRAGKRGDKPTGGHRFLDEMGLTPTPPDP